MKINAKAGVIKGGITLKNQNTNTADVALLERIKNAGLYMWCVACEVHISNSTLSYWFKRGLTVEQRNRVASAVDRLEQREDVRRRPREAGRA